ncbi:MAG: hypothetical protein ACOC90_11165 [Bacteroidota bacterium]
MDPSDFYNNFVKENYNDFINNEYSIRCGFNAAVSAFHLADHIYNYCSEHDQNKISGFRDKTEFLKYLSRKNQYFQDIQSITNAYKHLYQKKPLADHVTINSSGTIEVVPIRDIKIYGDTGEFVHYTKRKTGEKIRLSEALTSVIEMWKQELSHFGFII